MGGFDYPYQFEVETDMMAELTGFAGFGIVSVVLAIYLLILLVTFAFSVGLYVLQSLGLYTLAQRRTIKRSWLSWLPFGNLWILGSISDQYQYLVKGKIRNRRKLLLVLNIAAVAVCIAWVVGVIAAGLMASVSDYVVIVGMLTVFGSILLTAVCIALTVYEYIALYDLYRSCTPDNAVLYLILSVLVPWLIPLLVFVCRKQDAGMPPRKQPAPAPYAEPPAEEEPACQEDFMQPEEFEDQ